MSAHPSKSSLPRVEGAQKDVLNPSNHQSSYVERNDAQLQEQSMPSNYGPQPTWDLSSPKTAFSGIDDKDLRAKSILFNLMSYPSLNRIADVCAPLAFKIGLPIQGLIRSTIYRQFCGGERLESVSTSVDALAKRGVQSIVDYAVEGEQSEEGFDACAKELSRVIDLAKNQSNISYVAVKYTGLIAPSILEKKQSGTTLSNEEQAAYGRFIRRVQALATKAHNNNVRIFVDAEESWIQGTIDDVTANLMKQFNREKAIVHTTLQMYRTDRLPFLATAIQEAKKGEYTLGLKLVRGAYMEKERAYAAARSKASPIHPTKEGTDAAFDQAIEQCLNNLSCVDLCIASHNTDSCHKALVLMNNRGIPFDHEHVRFAQLYGMSDALSFGLAAAGASVSKYLPYGPVEKVFPYLVRRAKENSSVRGQSGRELALIRSEVARRRNEHESSR